MRKLRGIIGFWLATVAVFAFTLKFFEHSKSVLPTIFGVYCLQFLLFLLSVTIARHEPVKKNRWLFVNFALFFFISVPTHIYYFIGTSIFPGNSLLEFHFFQYVITGAYIIFLTFAIVYLAIDVVFRDFKTIQKYATAGTIVLLFAGMYYGPFIADPLHAYHSPDVQDWKALKKPYDEYAELHGAKPTPEYLASSVQLHAWKDGERIGVLFPDQNLARVREIYPYLRGSNYSILVLKPVYMNIIYMSVVCIGFILLFFGYQYLKDPPQGAYIEKVMFLLLIYVSLEILHAWRFIKSLEWQPILGILNVGQYATVAVLLSIAVIFGLRLAFITSAKGEFYENELSLNPSGITRWRDTLDNIVIEKFFNRKLILGRMFVNPEAKQAPGK